MIFFILSSIFEHPATIINSNSPLSSGRHVSHVIPILRTIVPPETVSFKVQFNGFGLFSVELHELCVIQTQYTRHYNNCEIADMCAESEF